MFSARNTLVNQLHSRKAAGILSQLRLSMYSTGDVRDSSKLIRDRANLKDAHRIVVKLGSTVVTKADRSGLALGRLATVVEQMLDLCHEGKQCVLVTSGAIALGHHHLGRNAQDSSRGARAAIGMAEMVSLYGLLFEQYNLRTAANLDVPTIRDNDSLAARLAWELSSDVLLLVSDVDGVYTTPPGSPGAKLIEQYDVEPTGDCCNHLNGQTLSFGLSATDIGTGGMVNKVSAAVWTVRQVPALSVVTANGLLAKPGSEAKKTVQVLHRLAGEALESVNLPAAAIGLIDTRKDVERILGTRYTRPLIDLVIPRGSPAMIQNIRRIVNVAGTDVPVLGHGAGVCHVYVDKDADPDKAIRIVTDSKCDHPAACNAIETLLVHRAHIENQLLKHLCDHLKIHGVTLFAGPGLIRFGGHLSITMESASNLSFEYGNLHCTVNAVESIDEAAQHIALYGSGHTETIVTENRAVVDRLFRKVDSACVFHNVSTRFADGYRFGLGAEVGINTGHIHASCPVGADGLVTTKWILRGEGQCASDFGMSKQNFKHEKLPVS
ncbi:hypothetical protein EG68_00789 [Paragonimus skrjabini miyazakii]|uniref:Uncharacterized protein n=1 Tax=Paragonimus skrjabini miyazakii TaxID=59628 RepID=A0A8S9ZCG5_9TREM|nr:hypothetical protein EG68_00789 [Paragonimus skrjabini miyazakii]